MPPRCFIALTLPRPAVASLLHACDSFVDLAPQWQGEKRVSGASMHITLGFLGPVEDDRIGPLASRIGESVAALPGFDVRLTGVEALPSARRATMLWGTVDDPVGSIATLRQQVLSVTSADGYERRFRPHITLVRARRPRLAPSIALEAAGAVASEAGKGPDGRVSVSSVTLFSSTLTAAGPEYRALATSALADPRPRD